MATVYSDPNVYQTEVDKSYYTLPQNKIGLAVIGRTEEGEAFIPTPIFSISDFYQKFGYPKGREYVSYTVKNYLKYGSGVLVTRIMSDKGYYHPNFNVLTINLDTAVTSTLNATYPSPYLAENYEIATGGTEYIIALFHHSEKAYKEIGEDAGITSTITDLGNGEYQINFTISDGTTTVNETYIFSIHSTASNYIFKVFSLSPKTDKYIYLHTYYDEALQKIIDYATLNSIGYTLNSYSYDLNVQKPYQRAESAWIISQTINNSYYKLFKFKTFSQGNSMNKKFKIVIANVRYANEVDNDGYGMFDVYIRDYNDTDQSPQILEKFTNLDLNPNSENFILRRIGDKHYEIQNDKLIRVGDFDNASNYVYVEVSDLVKSGALNKEIVPLGFERLDVFYTNDNIPASYPKTKFKALVQSNFYGSPIYDEKVVLGYDFEYDDNQQYLNYISIHESQNALNNVNDIFTLEECYIPNDAPIDAGMKVSESTLTQLRKFAVPFQYGFDGEDPAKYIAIGEDITADNAIGFDFSSSVADGTQALMKVLNIISDKERYDYNLLIVPGIIFRLHPAPISITIDMVTKRGDVMFVFDLVHFGDDINTAIITARNVDTNFAATYYPWVKIYDDINNFYMWTPPSVAVAEAYAFNDYVGNEWDAPAGLNRGIITSAIDVAYPLNSDERGILYDNRINSITVQREGIVVWGQKTLQKKTSALDRINVRRLLINLKKYVREKLRYFVFEKNSVINRITVTNILTPYFDMVKNKEGLYDYRIIFDETVNTNDVIDRNEFRGVIYIKPIETAEFIQIDWNVVGTDFNLNEI